MAQVAILLVEQLVVAFDFIHDGLVLWLNLDLRELVY